MAHSNNLHLIGHFEEGANEQPNNGVQVSIDERHTRDSSILLNLINERSAYKSATLPPCYDEVSKLPSYHEACIMSQDLNELRELFVDLPLPLEETLYQPIDTPSSTNEMLSIARDDNAEVNRVWRLCSMDVVSMFICVSCVLFLYTFYFVFYNIS